MQGGIFPDLRKEAVAFVNNHPFFGIAVGGSLGADKVGAEAREWGRCRYAGGGGGHCQNGSGER